MKLSDLRPGDRLTAFWAWGCVPEHDTRLVREDRTGLYVCCRAGRHYLSGQVGDRGHLVNLERVK